MRAPKLATADLAICQRLKFAREEILELTQKACANQMGIERTTLANYESCRTPLRSETALRFCRQFIISEEWFATGRFDAFHKALEERGGKGPWDWESFDRPISTRQCVDLWSDPVARHIREGVLFSEAYTNVLARRYAELVREFTYHQLIQLTDADRWETAVNYLKAIHERHVILLNNEAKNRGHQEPLYWRHYARRIYLAANLSFGQMMSAPPEDWGKFDLPNVTTIGNSESVPPSMPNLLQRLNEATKAHGKKSELASFLGATLPSVSVWLSGKREPGGETTLRMLEWVQAEETKQKAQPVLGTPVEPKTRTRKSDEDKPSPNRKAG